MDYPHSPHQIESLGTHFEQKESQVKEAYTPATRDSGERILKDISIFFYAMILKSPINWLIQVLLMYGILIPWVVNYQPSLLSVRNFNFIKNLYQLLQASGEPYKDKMSQLISILSYLVIKNGPLYFINEISSS